MDSLRGKLLIASPALVDPNFHRTVILIAEHTGEGAMGLVLNRPADTLVSDVVPDLSPLAEDDDAPVYFGGPVASDSVIVLAEFDDPGLAGVLLDKDLGFVGSDSGEMVDVADGVRRARIYAGHAGWGPGQLEGELEEDSWIIEPPQREEIFAADPDGLWAAVLRRKGREYALLATMPPDPSVN
jgi:putative transcriptional regulator